MQQGCVAFVLEIGGILRRVISDVKSPQGVCTPNRGQRALSVGIKLWMGRGNPLLTGSAHGSYHSTTEFCQSLLRLA